MAHLVVGWELGHGMGHIMPLRMLAEVLLEKKHRLTFIVRDVAVARRALEGLDVAWLQTPKVTYRPWELTRTDCYSQLLGNVGFRDAEKLASTVNGWCGLLEALNPDAALLEFAPSAMIACYLLDIPFALQGNGFFCPPVEGKNFGTMKEKMPAAQREREDLMLLESINHVIGNRRPSLQSVADLYRLSRHSVLTSFAELDHFCRENSDGFRGVWVPSVPVAPKWPKATGKRVFAYLNGRPGVDRVLAMLSKTGLPTLIYCPEVQGKFRAPFENAHCQFLDGLVDIRKLAQQSDLGVFHGNHSSTAIFMLAGTPTMQIPLYMEQLMFARRVKALGAGEIATLDQPQRIAAGLNALLTRPEYKENALRFSERYGDYDQQASIRQAAGEMEKALNLP
ncbi:hypothetical protein [Alcanivorax sp. DP30]|uniref:glycosyltransferase n=1 Tax=Alcanivorax sp. DP30 TaxID=2606217 RepID=UPI001369A464|nr:hypothetical protein [Alcanivorax sp. DP30]MZR63228.1 hypothetical protein [Alcanivorax sp. DP30]